MSSNKNKEENKRLGTGAGEEAGATGARQEVEIV